ncbi:MAG: hypothetical protein A3D31_09940 [Candidatus Fluviicola riflensis]|nr:MAG: hypothetical protein CHH17_14355 [Candidatus Fluviicola riflensis]OGS77327.1 MAG: hypothetical protein A3D31_09940 [Candidatus Fluviicola riflensis]OGS82623.1 MAG: hypothetical protein A2724_00050 [Fluviicola sp. RIFCSPHIGHO2_01_FULL_43_53]OGS83906.1 MAG: hypothetical protein A3E30_11340 [Fluviicola sp. RIFCSPHIGHO2_12_FULL_43_24]
MKLLLYVCTASFFLLTSKKVTAQENTSATVRHQLEQLNENWINKEVDFPILSQNSLLSNDVPLIQTHLSLVETVLRNESTDNLTPAQRENRIKCLDILHDYWMGGVFPKNINHKDRTPYFIDYKGTACAVGQLIIETGHEDFAWKIAEEDNNAYIKEMNYPELKSWATNYGFTVDELAWIQPAYDLCDTSCVYTTYIYALGGQAPYSYYWNDGQVTQFVTDRCPGNTYSCIIVDALGDTIPSLNCTIGYGGVSNQGNVITIPPVTNPILYNMNSTNDDGTCNGTATVTVTSSHSVMGYSWMPSGQNTQTATNLCAGMHKVTILTDMFCAKTDSVYIGTLDLMENNTTNTVDFAPNPFHDEAAILNVDFQDADIFIYNTLGSQIGIRKLKAGIVYREDLPNGLYLFKVVNTKGQESIGRFLIN